MRHGFPFPRAVQAALTAALLTLTAPAKAQDQTQTEAQPQGGTATQGGGEAQAQPAGEAAGNTTTGTAVQGEAGADPVLAVVNGKELRHSDVVASAADMPEQYRAQIDQLLPALVDRLVDMTLISEAAARQNLVQDPEVEAMVERFREDAVRQVAVGRFLKEKITDDVVKARYDKMVAGLPAQTEVRARHILVDSKEKAQEIIGKVQSDPAKFAEIAKAESKDPSAATNEGDLGYFTEEQMVPEFAKAAFALEPNTVAAEPVQTQFGWHVIQVLDKRPKPPPALEEVRPQIESELSQELVANWLKELRTAANVQRFNPDGTPMQTTPAAAGQQGDSGAPAAGGTEAAPAAGGEQQQQQQ